MNNTIIYTTYDWETDPNDFALEKLNGIRVAEAHNCFMLMNVNTVQGSYLGSSYGLYWVNSYGNAFLINNNVIQHFAESVGSYETTTSNSMKSYMYDIDSRVCYFTNAYTQMVQKVETNYEKYTTLEHNFESLQSSYADLYNTWRNSYTYLLEEIDKLKNAVNASGHGDSNSEIGGDESVQHGEPTNPGEDQNSNEAGNESSNNDSQNTNTSNNEGDDIHSGNSGFVNTGGDTGEQEQGSTRP